MAFPYALSTLSFILLLFNAFPSITQSVVPPSQRFTYINEGDFGEYIVEYDANYRILPLSTWNFQMFFYNTTPGEYTLALRLGSRRSETMLYWVWEANRGNPVGENATFSLGADGNLVLAEANGRIAWQSNTANKGVVGFSLQNNGNIVLYNAKGDYIWQSFDYPTDTLLVGQSLRLTGRNKLVSRLSEQENKDGPYSLVLEPYGFALYYTSSKNSAKPMPYYVYDLKDDFRLEKNDTLNVLTFQRVPGEVDTGNGPDPDRLNLVDQNGRGMRLFNGKYNSTYTYLRLGIDGSLNAYTYDYIEGFSPVWERTSTFFRRDSFWANTECDLPERCGQFGVCQDSQCVACPSPSGLLGWSKTCAPPKLASCKASDVTYYTVDGVDHFSIKHTRGIKAIREEDCKTKCTSDCKCAGFFYHRSESRCWIVSDIMTLTKVDNSTHVGYIKTSKV